MEKITAIRKTLEDPVKKVFQGRPLAPMNSAELEAGLVQLQEMKSEAAELIEKIKARSIEDIIDGKLNASDALMKKDGELEEAQRWALTIEATIKAATRSRDAAKKREEDAEAYELRAKLEGMLSARHKAAKKVDDLAEKLIDALAEVNRLGGDALRDAGIRLSGNMGVQLRKEHLKHLVEVQLCWHGGSLWPDVQMPVTRAPNSFARDIELVNADLINEWEERLEKKLGRSVNWANNVITTAEEPFTPERDEKTSRIKGEL